MEFQKYLIGCSARLSSKIGKSCHILPIVAWPWGGQSDLFRYYSSRDKVLLYESLTAGGKPSTWLPPGGCRADTLNKKEAPKKQRTENTQKIKENKERKKQHIQKMCVFHKSH